MTQDKAYIKLIAPDGLGALLAAGEQQLDRAGSLGMIQSLAPADWAEFAKAILELGGDRIPEEAREETEWMIDVLLSDDKASARLMALQLEFGFAEILKRIPPDFSDTYQNNEYCFYLEYDPLEWFLHQHPAAPGHRPYSHFTSGRLFAMAKIGILQEHDFIVEGTGLETKPEV